MSAAIWQRETRQGGPGGHLESDTVTETLMAYASDATQEGFRGSGEDISEGRMIITPNLAAKILTVMDYEKQRPSVGHQVNLLAQQMRAGVWLPGSQIAFGRFNGRLHLVNGRHRMCALREVGRAQQFQILIVDCASEDELHSLFYRFDTNLRPRSDAEILNSMEVAETHGITKSLATSVYHAGSLILNGFVPMAGQYSLVDPVLRTPDGKLSAAKKWWPYAKTFQDIIHKGDSNIRRSLRIPGVAAVALVTIEANQPRAVEFWTGVATDAPKGDPRRTLRDLLLSKEMRGHPTGMLYTSMAPATAWNAFCRGSRLGMIKVFPNAHVKIIGTKHSIGGVK